MPPQSCAYLAALSVTMVVSIVLNMQMAREAAHKQLCAQREAAEKNLQQERGRQQAAKQIEEAARKEQNAGWEALTSARTAVARASATCTACQTNIDM